MASSLSAEPDRRAEPRRRPQETAWRGGALLRPGQEVVIVNLSRRGVLLESSCRMRPGTRAELQLTCARMRRVLTGRVLRCAVVRLDPLRYRGALSFDEPLALDSDETG